MMTSAGCHQGSIGTSALALALAPGRSRAGQRRCPAPRARGRAGHCGYQLDHAADLEELILPEFCRGQQREAGDWRCFGMEIFVRPTLSWAGFVRKFLKMMIK